MSIRTKALGTVTTRTTKDFTGIELQGKKKLYFKAEFMDKLVKLEIDNDTLTKLADILTNAPLTLSIYKQGIKSGSLSIQPIEQSDYKLVARLLGLVKFIQISLPRYYQPVVMHVKANKDTNGGFYFDKLEVAEIDKYTLLGGEPLFLFSRYFKACRVVTNVFMLEGKFALHNKLPYILTSSNVLYTIDSTGRIGEVGLTLISNEEFMELFRYI